MDDNHNQDFRQPAHHAQRMNQEARRVLVYLMKQGVVLAADKPKLFEAICRYQNQIRQHLAEVFLYLTLDEKNGVAFIAMENAAAEQDDFIDEDENEEDTRSLITRRKLTLFDTLVLLALRKHYQERETAGEQKIMVDKERLLAHILPMMQAHERENLDKSKLSGSLRRFAERKILSKVSGDDERFEITPLIRYVVNTTQLDDFIKAYQNQLTQSL